MAGSEAISIADMTPRNTLYDLLKVSSSASLAEIQEAHRKLSRQLGRPGDYGLSQDEADARLKLIGEAYRTLSDAARRADYDAALAVAAMSATAPGKILDAPAVRSTIRQAPRILSIVNSSLKAVLLAVLIGVLVTVLYNSSRNAEAMRNAERLQEEKVKALQHAQEYGNKSASEIAADALEEERRREERAQREAERKQARELEQSRRYADSVSAQLRRDEERIRREKEYEQRRRDQEEARRKQEEEARIERQQRIWQQTLSR